MRKILCRLSPSPPAQRLGQNVACHSAPWQASASWIFLSAAAFIFGSNRQQAVDVWLPITSSTEEVHGPEPCAAPWAVLRRRGRRSSSRTQSCCASSRAFCIGVVAHKVASRVTSTRRQKQFLCQILISDANVVSVLEGLGALPLNWSYKAMPRSSRSELVCDGLRLLKNEGRLSISSRFTSRRSRNKANPCRFGWSPARRQSRWYITFTQAHRRLWKVNP